RGRMKIKRHQRPARVTSGSGRQRLGRRSLHMVPSYGEPAAVATGVRQGGHLPHDVKTHGVQSLGLTFPPFLDGLKIGSILPEFQHRTGTPVLSAPRREKN